MSRVAEAETFRLPSWLGDGGEVSELAYRIVQRALDAPMQVPGDVPTISDADLVLVLALELEVDEADVLRAFAELQRHDAMQGPLRRRPYDWARDGE